MFNNALPGQLLASSEKILLAICRMQTYDCFGILLLLNAIDNCIFSAFFGCCTLLNNSTADTILVPMLYSIVVPNVPNIPPYVGAKCRWDRLKLAIFDK